MTQTDANNGLTLFTVLLPWNPNDADEGTYETSVWALDVDDAVMQVALDMAEAAQRSGTRETWRQWAEDLVERAGTAQTVVMRVADTLEQSLRTFLSGPSGDASGVEEKLHEIMLILGQREPDVQRPRPRG